MRLYRAYCNDALAPGTVVSLSEEEARHLGQVRRVAEGQPLLVLNGAGVEADGEVAELRKKSAAIRIIAHRRADPHPTPRILAAAITKSSHFDEALQRAVELGMTEFLPLFTDRGVVELDEHRFANKNERWHRLFIEALKQCERTWLPRVHEPATLDAALDDLAARAIMPLACLERRDAPWPHQVPRATDQGVALLIGPEGGWSDDEAHRLAERTTAVTLGSNAILRAETASLAGLTLLECNTGIPTKFPLQS